MKSKLGVLAAIGVSLTLAMPTAASAQTLHHVGQLVGNDAAGVGFAVKRADGNLIQIGVIEFRGLPASCSDPASGLISLNASGFQLRGRTSFGDTRKLRGPDVVDGRVSISGEVSRGGRAGRGTVRAYWKTPSGVVCGTGTHTWRTRAAR